MENASYITLSHQMALSRQLDLVANNIANISTPAFKGESMMFIQYVAQTDDGGNITYVEDWAQVRDTSEGSFTTTGNPFDVAIRGSGYFVINTPEGQAYTRNGRFTLDANGQLVTSNGQPVLDANNRPIVIPEDATDVQIAEDGTISAGNGPLGRFQIVSFANDQDLQTMGDALYTTTQSPVPATGASIVQGAVEESNVQPILEITRMLSAQRSYVDAQNLIQSEGDLQTQTIDKLTQSA